MTQLRQGCPASGEVVGDQGSVGPGADFPLVCGLESVFCFAND